MNIMSFILGLSAVYMLFMVSVTKTENIRSALLFKLLPTVLSIGDIFIMLYLLNIIKFNL